LLTLQGVEVAREHFIRREERYPKACFGLVGVAESASERMTGPIKKAGTLEGAGSGF